MHLDALTLMVAGSFVSGVGAILLFGAWLQMRPQPRAILWWAIAFLLNGIGVAVLAAGFALDAPLAIAIGSGGIPLAMSVIWGGARTLRGRSVPWWAIAAVPAAWLAAGFLPFADGPQASAASATMALAALMLAAAANELWLGRDERLAARWPLLAVILLHAAIFAGGVIDVALGHLPTDAVPPLNSWFSLIHFEQMIFLLGSAVFIVLMCREREEASFMAAARIDALTGVAIRGAFFVEADRLVRRARDSGSPLAMIAFDLDHFKDINDSYGHQAGDATLRAFAAAAGAVLRPGDLFGRIGGEEFAVLLPGAGIEMAYVIADRMRHAFEALPQVSGTVAVRATVSGGVAVLAASASLEALLAAADGALYRAKAAGRNRVERGGPHHPDQTSNVIRIA